MVTILKRLFLLSLILVSTRMCATQEIVVHLTQANYAQVLEEADKPLIIKVSATWCGPCKRMKPIFYAFADLYKADYISAEIDIEEAPELSEVLKISALPTILIVQKKNIIGELVGAIGTVGMLKKKVEKVISDAAQVSALI